MTRLRAETVQDWARQAQGIELSLERAAALADSLAPLAAAATAGRAALAFDCEPALFLRVQRRWQEGQP